MHRIDGAGATIDGLFTEGDPTSAVPATVVTAAWLNAIQEEIAAVVEGAGLVLAKPDNGQLAEAIGALIAAAVAGFTLADGSVTAAKLAAVLDLSSKTLTLSAAQKAVAYLEYREEQPVSTHGGTFTSGAWQTRVLNTEVIDTGNHGALAANQITLDAGTYECHIMAPAAVVDGHQARLFNVTDSAVLLIGTSNWVGSGSTQTIPSVITGRFTLATPKAVRVEHRSSSSKATNGFGQAAGIGTEIYTVARFWKVG